MKYFNYLFVFFPCFCFSQEIAFGLKGGLNYTNYSGQSIEGLNFSHATNFHLGAVAQVEFNVNFKLQADLLYNIVGTEVKTLTTQYVNQMGYMSLPVALKLAVSSRKSFLEAGGQVAYLVNENQQNLTAVQDQNWQNTNDFDMSVFLGFSYQITDSFFLQARYHWGLVNVKTIDDKPFRNNGASLSIGYFLF